MADGIQGISIGYNDMVVSQQYGIGGISLAHDDASVYLYNKKGFQGILVDVAYAKVVPVKKIKRQ